MAYIYLASYSLLIGIGISFLATGRIILGIISIALGAVCLYLSINRPYIRSNKKRLAKRLLFSVLVVVIICGFLNVRPISGFFDNMTQNFSSCSVGGVAKVERIWSGAYDLCVELKPTSATEPNKTYTVELYEKGKLREKSTVAWNSAEINVKEMKIVLFSSTWEEEQAYGFEGDLSHIFSVKVYEP
ncbi:hypothetical protein ACFLXY_01495 [Chloroflexota bacterium]